MDKLIPIYEPEIQEKELEYVTKAIQSGWISSLGEYINIFEQKFAEFCGVKYALTVSNGTTALHLILAALGIGEGDEVIVPDFTFVATANVVRHINATVKFVDIDEETLCINPIEIEKAITPKTKAIIPVHLYGHPANMGRIMEIARTHNIFVIEDAAEAHGAEFNGMRVGSIGDCGAFSFYGNKIITTGEGGMITTNSEEIYQNAKSLRDHAMSKTKRYWHERVGYNYRMTNLQAALGVAQLERIEEIITKKTKIFETYSKYLQDIKGIRLNPKAEWAKNVYWMICLEIMGHDEEKRDNFMKKLKDRGIDSRPYFYPISDMPMYETVDTKVAHKVYKRGINLPSYNSLKEEDIAYICNCVKDELG